ncbi:hypothetical protein B296_00015542 [Ensete ventricosum]|uniref:Uncharacterized protein n=1 Tax=Ensete ventricosum TaxID=4639 RepID=A0A427AR31_ENSVE|nr:hypothetical protein B296_00015542 [Ensete ventricosum]
MDLSALCDMSNLSVLKGMSKLYVGKSGPVARATTSLPEVEKVHAELRRELLQLRPRRDQLRNRRRIRKTSLEHISGSEGGFALSTSEGAVHAAARGAHGVGGKANHIGKSSLGSLVLVSFPERMV